MKTARLDDLDYSVLQQCMHCGMCLPSCPTYLSTRKERHSPRGRIALMRAVADGEFEIGKELADEMSYCLGCLACTSACPAGVDYTAMFETARAETEDFPGLSNPKRRFLRWLLLQEVFLYPNRLNWIGKILRFYQRTGLDQIIRRLKLPYLLGPTMGNLEPQTPRMESLFSDERIDEWERPPDSVEFRGRVGLLSGCVQSMAFAQVNRDTADVLLFNGWEVYTPLHQHCCGSLHAHNGAPRLARQTGAALMEQFRDELGSLDAVISNAGGCGSHLKHYQSLFDPGTSDWELAGQWDAKVKDIHEFLVTTGFAKPNAAEASGEQVKLTYHESCHLCHGQKIKEAPREILRSLPGFHYEELPGSDMCCGSAGIYNIVQPDESRRILKRKTECILQTGAETVATSNPGCHLQLQAGLAERAAKVRVDQPVSLLAHAYRQS